MIKKIIKKLAEMAGFCVVEKTMTGDNDPDGGFVDHWNWRLP